MPFLKTIETRDERTSRSVRIKYYLIKENRTAERWRKYENILIEAPVPGRLLRSANLAVSRLQTNASMRGQIYRLTG